MNNNDKKLLLIEDDPFLIDLYSAKIKKEGINLVVADDEVEGFEKAITEKPAVVVLDISLPEHEDFGLLKKIKEASKTNHLPVIVISDLDGENDVDRALSIGACKYLIRSQIEFEDLIKEVNYFIAKEIKK